MRIERPRGEPAHEAEQPEHLTARSGEWRERTSIIARSSVRPSAFGPPRVMQPRSAASRMRENDDHGDDDDTEIEAELTIPMATPMSFISTTSALERGTTTDDASERISITTEIDLLPLNLPKPPLLPNIDEAPRGAPRRFPWASLSVFACALLASSVSLVHYARQVPAEARGEETRQQGVGVVRDPPRVASASMFSVPSMPLAPRPEPLLGDDRPDHQVVRDLEQQLTGSKVSVDDALFAAGLEALATGDERLAESMFARLIDSNARSAQGAYGLSRVRIAQRDLEAAEGWIRLAIAERPREPSYRHLHADLLQETGFLQEAQAERAHARALEKH